MDIILFVLSAFKDLLLLPFLIDSPIPNTSVGSIVVTFLIIDLMIVFSLRMLNRNSQPSEQRSVDYRNKELRKANYFQRKRINKEFRKHL